MFYLLCSPNAKTLGSFIQVILVKCQIDKMSSTVLMIYNAFVLHHILTFNLPCHKSKDLILFESDKEQVTFQFTGNMGQ